MGGGRTRSRPWAWQSASWALNTPLRRYCSRRRGLRPQRAQVEVHRRPVDAGRLRGRDRHPPALHDAHRARRRRRRGAVVHAARAGLRGRLRALRPPAGALGGRRQDGGLPGRHLHPQGDHLDGGHRRGRQDHGLHARPQRQDRPEARPAGLRRAVHRDLDALHAPRLPRALRAGLAALHLPVPRRRLRLRGPGRRRPAGAARSTASTPASATASSRSGRATRSTASSSASTPTAIPPSRSTASASTSTRPASPRPSSSP